MEYVRAGKEEIDLFVDNRMEFIASIKEVPDPEGFRQRTKRYITEHIDRGDLLIFGAVERQEMVAACMACLFQVAPLPSCPSGKSAKLLSVYTKEGFRRQGHAETLIRMLLAEAKRCGVEKIYLDYTDDGFPLYQKLGFTILEKQMELEL